jgi:hypothetical protein
MIRRLFMPVTCLAMFLACGESNPTVRHMVLSEGLSELHSQFNADTGKVRAIFLAAPT